MIPHRRSFLAPTSLCHRFRCIAFVCSYILPVGSVYNGLFEADEPHGAAVIENSGVLRFSCWFGGVMVGEGEPFDPSKPLHATTLSAAKEAKVTPATSL